jgi:AcrR family transcriptional regulator
MGTSMTIDHAKQGARHLDSARAAAPGEGSSTRRRILQIALTLMAQRGVDGTSMRDLASAAGLNVASLYHYFPSKGDILEAVLVEQGFLPLQAPRTDGDGWGDGWGNGRGNGGGNGGRPATSTLEQLLADILVSMFEIQDFVRLMVGETMRDESTARAVGLDLFGSFQTIIEDWVREHRPDLDERSGAAAVARLLSAMVVGIFVEHAAGVLSDDGADLTALSLQRAREAAQIVGPPH